jgi:hypothetical protein
MKNISILVWAFLACNVSSAQLIIYSSLNQQGNSGTCVARTIYTDVNIPNGLDNSIKSITLKQGFMATLADSTSGAGEGFSYIATVSDLNVNLANVLRDKVSFIRVLPIKNVKKKGAGEQNNITVGLLNVGWFYDWGVGDVSTETIEFAPMLWGAYSNSIETSINTVINKTNLTHFLAFNEPDSRGQSGVSGGGMADNVSLAIPFYKKMLRSGYRMGSPATREEGFKTWLKDFSTLAKQDTIRIDFVAVHWYDWGNWSTTPNPNPDVNALFNRFKAYINNVYTLHQKPIWITEFNANPNRPSAVQEAFMALALPWLETDPRVERYAYFFEKSFPPQSEGVLTPVGRVYSNHVSTPANPENVFDKRAGATTAINENYDASFLVYPSISTENKIEVVFKEVSEAAQIKIFNINGQLLSTHNLQTGSSSKTIDIANFTEGGYILTLQDKGRIQSRKFIKQ